MHSANKLVQVEDDDRNVDAVKEAASNLFENKIHWCVANQLSINSEKTNVVLFHVKNKPIPENFDCIQTAFLTINRVKYVHYLGLMIVLFCVILRLACIRQRSTSSVCSHDRLVITLQWRHNGRDGVSNHQPHDVYSTVYSDADQRKHQSSESLAFVRGIHWWSLNSRHKGPVTRKMFPFDDVIMIPRTLKMRAL